MITIDQKENLLSIVVLGEFTLADFKEFEDLVRLRRPSQGILNLLFDLRQMADFTLDVAWEEIQFSRQHPHDFGRVAVLTDSQWVTWSAWLSQAFVDADIVVFADESEARNWLESAS